VTSSLVFTQNSAGVGGSAQGGDHFGAALSPYGAAIGVPGDDVGKLKDAGTVQVLDPNVVTGALTPLRSLSQNSAGVPGTAEAGDQFGAALSTGYYRCKDAYQLAVGSPGEDVGKAKNAGTVTVLTVKGWSDSTCVSKLLSQGGGKGLLGGAVETGDGVGSSLGSVNGNPDPTNRLDTLVVGAPGEDIGKTKNTGRTTIWSGHSKGFAVSFGYQGGDFSNLGYGKVFGTESINSTVA
jgi:hypothetical protein